MSVSHLCTRCGTELARVRSRADVVLGLRVVVCPTCNAASVRRRHPGAALWRWWLRALAAANVLVMQTIGMLLAIMGVAGACNGLRYELDGRGANLFQLAAANADERARMLGKLRMWFEDEGWASVLGWAILCVIAGTWITAGLAHWRRRGTGLFSVSALGWGWLGWSIAVALVNCLVFGAQALESWLLAIPEHPSPTMPRGSMPKLDELPHALVMIVPSGLVALLGIPLGLACRYGGRARARRRFIKRLRKLRARRRA